MTRSLTALLLLFALTAAACAEDNILTADEKAEGFKLLFDGKTLDNWTPLTSNGTKIPLEKSNFSVRDGTLCVPPKSMAYWIRYDRQFADFVLRLDYKLAKKTNSGIFLRVPPGKVHPAYRAFEVQLLDDYSRKPDKHTTGSIYDVIAPTQNMSKPVGQWNSMEITCDGPLVTVVHNGVKVVDADFSKLTKPIGKFSIPYAKLPRVGFFGLQYHGHELAFKNIRIKELNTKQTAK